MTADDNHETDHGELRSFGRRRGRPLSARQADLWEHGLKTAAVDVRTAPPTRLGMLFPSSPEQVWLEIGFGGGEHLIWQAQHNPSVGLIGCEPYRDGVVKVLSAIEEQNIGTVRVYPDDARDLLRWLPEASIARAFVLFPDPWPKRRQQKRRLVNGALLSSLVRVLRPGAELRIGTDIADYARTMFMALRNEPRLRWTALSAADWTERPADWPQTRYEAKAVREGRKSCYLSFVRV